MALLGDDNPWSARGLVGRAFDGVRDMSGALTRRAGALSGRMIAVVQNGEGRAPRWLLQVLKLTAPTVKTLTKLLERLANRIRRLRIVKFVSGNLLRRILFSNFIGFAILFAGILYWTLDSGWVIKAKRDALKIQAQMIAVAIASKTKVTSTAFTIDPESIPGTETARIPLRDDGLSAWQKLTIQPQHVSRILKKLIDPIKTRGKSYRVRARIYDLSGAMVVDSSQLLRRGQITGPSKKKRQKNLERPRTRNIWTRLQHWLIDKEFQVYKEIGRANGMAYPEVRLALNGKPQAMVLLNRKGEQIVSVTTPIFSKKGPVRGVLLLSTQPGEVDDILEKQRNDIWPLAALALLATIVASLLMARTVAGPMKRLSETAEQVSIDINAHEDLPGYSERTDEVGQMARAFRSMTSALFERIEASEKFAADVAHELKNPLTAASSTAQSLEYAKTEEQRDQLVTQIQVELKRLNRLITDVSSASRLNAELARQSSDPVAVDVVLTTIVEAFKDKTAGSGFVLKLDAATGRPEEFVVSGNEGRIAQVFTNIIDNALSFSTSGDTVVVKARRVGDFVEVSVSDDGPGIEEDKLKTIFSRFYTYRPTDSSSRGNNSGLGLSISAEIIAAHGGTIWAENRMPKNAANDAKPDGSRFIVMLPARVIATARGGTIGRGGRTGAARG